MTPNEIEEMARLRYNAVGDNFYSSAMILDIIYQASMELALEAFVIENHYTTTSTASTRAYDLPTNAFAVKRVEYNGKKIYPVGIDDDPRTSTTDISGTPTSYSLWNEELILYPTPSTSSVQIDVWTYNRPAAITSASTLEVPAEYHLKMIDLILSVMYAKDQNQSMATYHRNLWEKSIADIKRHNRKKKQADMFAVVRDQEEFFYRPL